MPLDDTFLAQTALNGSLKPDHGDVSYPSRRYMCICFFQFEGIPVHPHVGRFWEIIEKYKVTKFYTAPTAIRLLMKYGREPLQR